MNLLALKGEVSFNQMNKKIIFETIKQLCKPLTEIRPEVKAIWIFGSFVRKKDFSLASDIDILVLLDDASQKLRDEQLRKILLLSEAISIQAKKSNLHLHFQLPIKLTSWWVMIREGEPWTITTIKDSEIIYDNSGYLFQLKRLLKKGNIYRKEERAEKLIERAYNDILEARQILLNRIPNEILMTTIETAQRVLSNYNKYPLTPKDTVEELKKTFVNKKIISKTLIDDTEEMYELVKKINKGALSEFNGKDLDRYYPKMLAFISEMESIHQDLELASINELLLKSYSKAISLAKKTLLKKVNTIPDKDEEVLKLFEEVLIKTDIVDEIHLQTLKDLIAYKNDKEKAKVKKERYIRDTYIRSFEIALSNIVDKKKVIQNEPIKK